MLAHALQFGHQRLIVAVAGDDAEAVDEGVDVSHFHGVDDQLDIQIVLLALAVAQRRDDGEGVGQQALFEVGIAVRVAIDLAQQYVAAYLDLFDDVAQHGLLRAHVFQVYKYCKIRFTHKKTPLINALILLYTENARLSTSRSAPQEARGLCDNILTFPKAP